MTERILNIYLVIEKNFVTEFRAEGYDVEGDDEDKINFLKSRVESDFDRAVKFNAPTNKNNQFMKYNKFARLEQRGMHFELFEEIFLSFDAPERPLICVTPVVDGAIYHNK
ncbi:MAG: hypothetical protein ACM3O3_04430 [Syntrophothermus sp.]